MTELSFPKLPEVRLGMWSARQKITYKTGYTPTMWGDSQNTYTRFAEDLTPQQVTDVTAIMNNPNVQGPDVNLQIMNNTYVLRDIWVWKDWIAAESGIDFSIWWRESGSFPGQMDEIVFIPTDPTHTMQRLLINPQKNALVSAIETGSGWE